MQFECCTSDLNIDTGIGSGMFNYIYLQLRITKIGEMVAELWLVDDSKKTRKSSAPQPQNCSNVITVSW